MTPAGLFCRVGGFFIDPVGRVDRAVVTHGHSDHARPGMNNYLCTSQSESILRQRLGRDISIQTLDYGQKIRMGDVTLSMHPSGHIHGAAQIRIELKGRVSVITGDYKRQEDPTANAFELVPCHHLISECTFGLPIYRWPEPEKEFQKIREWWQRNALEGRTSVLFCYSLGKAQRLQSALSDGPGPVWVHGAIAAMNECIQNNGVSLPAWRKADTELIRKAGGRGLVLAPPSTDESAWLKKFGPNSRAMASGWMQVRGRRRHRSLDRGFVVSDHVDWSGLMRTIRETGCEMVYLTHGYSEAVIRRLREMGQPARSLGMGDRDNMGL